MKEEKTALILDPLYFAHDPGPGHPEAPERYNAVLRGIADKIEPGRIKKIQPSPADRDTVELCHSSEYVDSVIADITSGSTFLRTGDTDVCSESLDSAFMAVGGLSTAVDAVINKEVNNAFCAVRPPGHHAESKRGMGFCIFNNIAIAARYAQKKYGIGNVLIVDWDVHHGNGTQEIFYEDPTVFYFSTHQWPFYPGSGQASETGAGKGKGSTLNCPFPAGSGYREVIGSFKDKLVPAMRDFKPELVLISAGFDARIGDMIGNFLLGDDAFADLTGIMMDIADEYADGRVVSALEGGYTLSGLASSAAAHVRRLSE